jgi:aminoglycoside 6-adenylyltransferase
MGTTAGEHSVGFARKARAARTQFPTLRACCINPKSHSCDEGRARASQSFMNGKVSTAARIVKWAETTPTIRAVLLTSSRANPHAAVDHFSDYDVIVAVTDILPFFENGGWLTKFGDVLVVYRDPIKDELGYGRFAYITQYEDGTKIDFTLWPVALLKRVAVESRLPEELDIGYSVLLDKDQLTRQLQPPSHEAHVPSLPTEAEFQTLVEEFFHESTYVAKHLWRGDLLPLKYNLDQAMKQIHLRRMLEWRIEIDHHWSVRPGAYGRGMRKLVAPSVWEKLEQTYVGPALQDNWNALFSTISLFREIAQEVAGLLGFHYPDELDKKVVAYLQNVRAARRPVT